MVEPTSLVILGSGGHAADVLDVVEAINRHRPSFVVLGVLDDGLDSGRLRRQGVDLLGGIERLESLDTAWVAAVGWPAVRMQLATRATASGQPAATLVSPFADIGSGTEIGAGSVILGNARLSPLSVLGSHVLVSYLAAVGHDSIVGNYTSLMPGVMISGGVQIGEQVLVGTNASVVEGVQIGDRATIGAGAVVLADVSPGATVVGVPAREVSRSDSEPPDFAH